MTLLFPMVENVPEVRYEVLDVARVQESEYRPVACKRELIVQAGVPLDVRLYGADSKSSKSAIVWLYPGNRDIIRKSHMRHCFFIFY
jgi:hypothetical protein